MVEKLKQYWVYIVLALVAVYFLFFNKKGKKIRKRGSSYAKTRYRGAKEGYRRYKTNYRVARKSGYSRRKAFRSSFKRRSRR